ncbi:MAG: hypothetical protein KBS34_02040, partial [Phascolarctobacterium sp.]|nr:hypothetical protein [Candidatus Phascolarctobacterium equi]
DFKETVFVSSGKKNVKVKKKEVAFVYDKYVSQYRNTEGEILYKKNYYMLYDSKGILKAVETCLEKDGQESSLQIMEIKDISTSVTDMEKNLPTGYLVYAAGMGDMNDLVNRNVVVEDYRKMGKTKGTGK